MTKQEILNELENVDNDQEITFLQGRAEYNAEIIIYGGDISAKIVEFELTPIKDYYGFSVEFINNLKRYMTAPDLETDSQFTMDYRCKNLVGIDEHLSKLMYTDNLKDYAQHNIPPKKMKQIYNLVN